MCVFSPKRDSKTLHCLNQNVLTSSADPYSNTILTLFRQLKLLSRQFLKLFCKQKYESLHWPIMSTNFCKIRKGQSHFRQKFNEFSHNDNLQYGRCQCPLTITLADLGKRTVSQAENRFCCKIDPQDGIGKEPLPKITFILIRINQVG